MRLSFARQDLCEFAGPSTSADDDDNMAMSIAMIVSLWRSASGTESLRIFQTMEFACQHMRSCYVRLQ